MSLVKRETAWPLDLVLTEDRVDKAFRDMFRGFFGEGWRDWPAESKVMKVEEFVEDGTYVIRAEVPGIDPEKDVDLTVADGVLHLTATREERSEEERPDGYRTEFHYGSLRRSIRLPEGASADDITASYTDGILEVRIPAPKEVEKPTAKIAVTRG
ncbi:MAG TPA: Hsp20/alpha crystallin family protein [Ornithinibacter sp.]|jgi:HSP20 family protein|nr:Hsp20/alpha crystallin family protein [Ornithinibacter sp.]